MFISSSLNMKSACKLESNSSLRLCVLLSPPQIGDQEINGLVQGTVEGVWQSSLDEFPDR